MLTWKLQESICGMMVLSKHCLAELAGASFGRDPLFQNHVVERGVVASKIFVSEVHCGLGCDVI